jgi:hypothetical protein
MSSKDRATRDPKETPGAEDRFAAPKAGVTARETEQSEEKGDLCVSDPLLSHNTAARRMNNQKHCFVSARTLW